MEDRAVARWALRTRDSCKELRQLDFVGAGAVQVRLAALASAVPFVLALNASTVVVSFKTTGIRCEEE